MSGQEWTSEQRRQVLRLTHGFPLVVLVSGLAVAMLILWSGNSVAAGAVTTATLAATGIMSRQGRLAAPAALRGVGIVTAPPAQPEHAVDPQDQSAPLEP